MKRRKASTSRLARKLARARMNMALALTDFGEEALRRRLARNHPGISESEIAAQAAQWYRQRPGAELGDSVGKPILDRGYSLESLLEHTASGRIAAARLTAPPRPPSKRKRPR